MCLYTSPDKTRPANQPFNQSSSLEINHTNDHTINKPSAQSVNKLPYQPTDQSRSRLIALQIERKQQTNRTVNRQNDQLAEQGEIEIYRPINQPITNSINRSTNQERSQSSRRPNNQSADRRNSNISLTPHPTTHQSHSPEINQSIINQPRPINEPNY